MTETNSIPWAIYFAGALALQAIGCEGASKQELGRLLFQDSNLSARNNQSCASCHSGDTGGTGAEAELNAHGAVYEGSILGRFGNRKPPATSYATLAPLFTADGENGFRGGNFWDGRGTGWKLGNPAADQAQGPFLNPLEQALPSAEVLVQRVCSGRYGHLFRTVWGGAVCADATAGYAAIARSIAEYEGSSEVNQFSSKFDRISAGAARFDEQEALGYRLFSTKAQCSSCHSLETRDGGVLFTDFGFDNIGVPRNPENPFYTMDRVLIDGEPVNPQGSSWVDLGLASFLKSLAEDASWRALPHVPAAMLQLSQADISAAVSGATGKHRVPTLRNVDKRPSPSFVKAYGHNGYFKSLYGLVHFYNTRDVLPRCEGALSEQAALANDCWPEAEVAANMNTSQMGHLELTPLEENAIVAFLGTLTDEDQSSTAR